MAKLYERPPGALDDNASIDDDPRPWWGALHESRWAVGFGMMGGVLILVAAFVTALFLTGLAAFGAADEGFFDFPEVPLLVGVWGLLTGGVVLLATLRVKEDPDEAAWAGVAMLAAGLLSFLALGGFLVGGVLAIVGGVLAIGGSRGLTLSRGLRARLDAH